MIHRPTVRLAGLLLALSALGCSDDGYEVTDLSGRLEVQPLFYGIDEGFPPVQFTATIDGDPVQVTWESSDPTVATVSPTGLVTPLNDGLAAITATLVSNTNRKKSASFTVNELFGTPLVSGAAIAGIGGVGGAGPAAAVPDLRARGHDEPRRQPAQWHGCNAGALEGVEVAD